MMKRWSLLLALALSPRFAEACTICFGGSNSPSGQAMSMAIFFLLAILGSVFLGAGGFVFYLARRAKSPLADPREFLSDDPE